MKQITTILLLAALLILSTPVLSQGPPPPPSGGHGQSGNQTGGNAPLEKGVFTLLTLGILYGGIKLNVFRKDISNRKERK